MGQHYDDELSRVVLRRAEGAAARSGARGRVRLNIAQTARILAALEPVLAEVDPALVLVYGDANSTLARALAAARAAVPVGHVEAGMRSFDHTMPEELNRVLTDHASDHLPLLHGGGAAEPPAGGRPWEAAPGGRRDGRRLAGLPALQPSARRCLPIWGSSRATTPR